MPANTTFLEMLKISKGFPGVQALDNVSFDLHAGEIHALVGENGAGKSTLMKVLSGVYQQDSGDIFLNGDPIKIQSPRDAQTLGISIVHQELNLFPNLSVMENIYSGHMPRKGVWGFEDRKTATKISKEFLEKFEFSINPKTPLELLSVGQRQVVEICKALVQNARVLILDEPTASLSEHESELLFKVLAQLKQDGISIIYISHRLEEVFTVADRVTVLRDGKFVNTSEVGKTNIDQVVHSMVGREIRMDEFYGAKESEIGKTILEVKNLSVADRFKQMSFSLQAGEILGFAGLVGSGRTDVALACFGACAIDSGSILIDGVPQKIKSPRRALELGIAYLPENRQQDGLFFDLSVRENISVTHLESFAKYGFVQKGREKAEAEQFRQDLKIQTPTIEQRVLSLSGGNQQKVILARWLAVQPKVLIVDEPTKGIDVGSKQEIYSLLRALAAKGVGVIVISSEMPEVIGLSDRILVMHEGKLTGVLAGAEITEENIMSLAAGQPLTRSEVVL